MKLLLYCTKAKPILRDYRGKAIYNRFVISPTDRPFTSDDTQPILNGKIVAECDFDVEEIIWNKEIIGFETTTLTEAGLCRRSKLLPIHLSKYLKDKKGYAIHIKNLHIFDKPRELSEYYSEYYVKGIGFTEVKLKIAPQNMRYCYNICNQKYILISIKPEWLCKILNGEKTIEVRKKVLKEMIK